MNTYQMVEEYYEPLKILDRLSNNNSEMSESQQAFLCGLIKQYKPKKLVEVGVAAGGTSTVILSCIQTLKLSTKMFSVDLAETYYRDVTKAAGYLIDEISTVGVDFKLLLGKAIAARMEEIGSDIDFLVLDTTHVLPGEVLDFLCIFPYLKQDAVVVLHDTALHFYTNSPDFATSVLYHSVVADKFLNNRDEYPNIAAFRLNEDTKKYIIDVFAALLMPWRYIPEEKVLIEYERILNKYYPEEHRKLYQQAKLNNASIVANKPLCVQLGDCLSMKRFPNILLYGTGKLGQRCLSHLREQNIAVKGFVVSDGWKKEEQFENLPVYEYSAIPYLKEDTLILLTNFALEPEKILKESTYQWFKVFEP